MPQRDKLPNPGFIRLWVIVITFLSIIYVRIITPESIALIIPMAFFVVGQLKYCQYMAIQVWEYILCQMFHFFWGILAGLGILGINDYFGENQRNNHVPLAGVAIFLFALGY